MPAGNPSRDERRAEYLAYLDSAIWQEKRKIALERAEGRCQLCNSAKRLDVHHRTYERFGGEELPGDLTVLCRGCHEHFHDGRKPTKTKRERRADKAHVDGDVRRNREKVRQVFCPACNALPGDPCKGQKPRKRCHEARWVRAGLGGAVGASRAVKNKSSYNSPVALDPEADTKAKERADAKKDDAILRALSAGLEKRKGVVGPEIRVVHNGRVVGGTPPTLPLSLAEIEAAKTPAGGWTKEQLAKWGVPWPPPRGWKRRLVQAAQDARRTPTV